MPWRGSADIGILQRCLRVANVNVPLPADPIYMYKLSIPRMHARHFTGLSSELHELATQLTGLRGFGLPYYREAMQILSGAIDSDLTPTPSGWYLIRDAFLLQPLVCRLYAERALIHNNNLLSIPITKPLIVTGLPRTGTTALHRLLALDPQFQGLPYWLIRTPLPRPPQEDWDSWPEYRACGAHLHDLFAEALNAYECHPITARDIEECGGLLHQDFWFLGLHSLLPSYDRWLRTQSAEPAYRRYLNTLRVIGGDQPQKRWILKYPYHLSHLDTLLRLVPDACIIQTHRDPLKAIPSFCHLIYTRRRLWEGDRVPVNGIGPGECVYWRDALVRAQEVRQQNPSQFFDVEHSQFLHDPLSVVQSIYRYFDLTLPPDVEKLFVTHCATHKRAAPRSHRPNDWGLTDSDIISTFSEYRDKHQFH